jgi:hypothetical protein
MRTVCVRNVAELSAVGMRIDINLKLKLMLTTRDKDCAKCPRFFFLKAELVFKC